MKVRKSRGSEPFVALSYMWAPSDDDLVQLKSENLSELETDGLRGRTLPSIISDAIALCCALGKPYLWVDRLCIVQDNQASKHVQICAMDAIYSSATFTIMAALKSKANTGLPGCPELPGCPGRPRLTRVMGTSRKYYDGWSGGGIESGMEEFVNRSLWDHRGWTFQERLLSRRRLFITEVEVILQCQNGTLYEEFLSAPHHVGVKTESRPGHPWKDPWTVPTYPDILNSDNLGWDDYRFCVKQYTKRELSRRSDILHAFEGVGNVLARGLGTKMLFGIPEKYLRFALLWERENDTNARTRECARCRLLDEEVEGEPDCAPSWSWASAYHPVNFDWVRTMSSHKGPANRGLIDFYRYDSAGPNQERSLPRKIHARDSLESIKVPLFREFITGIPSTFSQDALEAARGLPGSLVFNTATAILSTGRYRDWNPWKRDLEELYSSRSAFPGYGLLVGKIREKNVGRILRRLDDEVVVVVIAGTSKKRQDQEGAAFLEVMLVERDPHKPHVVRRKGLGQVAWESWQLCNPQWETIVLT